MPYNYDVIIKDDEKTVRLRAEGCNKIQRWTNELNLKAKLGGTKNVREELQCKSAKIEELKE